MKKAAIALVSVALVLLAAWLVMDRVSGRPMSTDLSLLGQGQPAIVLAFENFAPTSMDAMNQLNQIRDRYEPDVQFLVADLGTPDGRAFSSDLGLSPGSAVLIDAAGSPVRTYSIRGGQWSRNLDQDLRGLL